jgi:DNA-binding MarR family transcriptional regulator
MKQGETVCYQFKVIWHAISRMYNEEGTKHGLTATVGYVLLNIDTKEGTPATKIGPLLGMEPTSMSRMLNNMEKDQLITREKDLVDKRSVKIKLTDKGKEKRQIARKVVKKFNAVIENEIEQEKLKAFYEVASEINSIIERKNIF